MSPADYEENLGELIREIKRLTEEQPKPTLEISWASLVMLVAQLQLALRHPRNPPQAARSTRAFLDRLLSNIEELSPSLARLLRHGDDPAFDTRSN